MAAVSLPLVPYIALASRGALKISSKQTTWR